MNLHSSIGQSSVSAIVFFVLFVGIVLAIAFWAARRMRSTADFFVAGRNVGAAANGLALAGDFLSVTALLGVSGLLAVGGFDGIIFAMGAIIAWPMMMFLIAEPLRNVGKYTFADFLCYRLPSPTIRVLAVVSTLIIVLMNMLNQMVGVGALIKLLFGIPYTWAVILTGAVLLACVLFGGMIAATWIQIIKAVLMVITAVVLCILVLAMFGFSPVAVFQAAAERGGPAVLGPGRALPNAVESLSLGMSFAFGTSALPHIMMRFYTVPDARAARLSALYAASVTVFFYLAVFVIGFGGMALLGADFIRSVDRGGNMALPLLAEYFGGSPLLGFVSAVVFAMALAAVAGMVIAGAAALSHDLWVTLVQKGEVSERQQMLVARIATVVLCVIAVILGLIFEGQNVAYLTGLAAGVAASLNFPVLVLAIFWSRLTTAGAATGMLTGLISSLVLVYLSPIVQMDVLHHAESFISLRTPAIVSLPLAFIATVLVSLLTTSEQDNYPAIRRKLLVGTRS